MSSPEESRVHLFEHEPSDGELPARLNDPFDTLPHPLCKAAAAEVMRHAESHLEWHDELAAGKMFGVLVVRDGRGKAGFLAAFSGNLGGANNHPYFVPPVYDMLQPDDFFRREERCISELTRRIELLQADPARAAAAAALAAKREETARETEAVRCAMREAKARRDAVRAACSDASLSARLDDESRREKSQYRRLKALRQSECESLQAACDEYEREIRRLKEERRSRSEALQMKLFSRFEVSDARGQLRSLTDIFASTPQRIPPAGTGECAAPKLFHYVFTHALTPLAVAEFWYGASPAGEVRRHGAFYPACRGKCKPLLDYMLRHTPLERRAAKACEMPRIIFEDGSIAVVEKPAGMLSVRGKVALPSVEEWAAERFSDAQRPRAVHRLDMDVSGLLLIAKDDDTFCALQEQFRRRTVCKRYTAVLEGDAMPDSGTIELPLRPDPLDRPRQRADRLHGKPSLTRYRILKRGRGRVLAELEPVTGRTHQLRVHAAAAEGLDSPVAGDTLYGARPDRRLALHSRYIEFTHPHTLQRMSFDSPCAEVESMLVRDNVFY